MWPAALLAYAIGGSLLSLIGIFVGFAQVMGAFAAWIGGFLAVQYVLILTGRQGNALPPLALWIALLSLVSTSLVVALFAPDASLSAFAMLSLVLVVPTVMPDFSGLSPQVRPFVFGLLAAVPAAAAILIALWQRNMFASP